MYSLDYAKTLLPTVDLAQQADPCLLVIWGNQNLPGDPDSSTQTILVNKPLLLIGRDSGCQVRVPDRFMSRIHAALTRVPADGSCWLRDGDGRDKTSANGVFVNGQRLVQAYPLQDGDHVRFGTRVFSSFHSVRAPIDADRLRHQTVGLLLLEAGLITPTELETAQTEQEKTPLLLGEYLVVTERLRPETMEFFLRDEGEGQPLAQLPGKHPIGEYLKAAGLVTEHQIVEALRLQKRKKIYFGKALVERGFIKEQTLDFFLRRYGDLEPAMPDS
jgi:pSer/pThr/pTyr-binding forkhead associated (FHA) protein